MGRRKGGQRNNNNNNNNNNTNSVSREDPYPYHPLWDVHFDPLEDVPQFLRCTPTLQPRSPPAAPPGSAGPAATTAEQRERNRSGQEQPSATPRSSLSPPPAPLPPSSAAAYRKQRILEMEPDVIFDPPPPSSSSPGAGSSSASAAAFKNRDLSPDAPWLGLHLEQQTVIMNEFASERRKLREENELLRKMLEEAEDTIRALESNDGGAADGGGGGISTSTSRGGGGGKSDHSGNNDGNDDDKKEDVVISADKKNARKGGGGGGGGGNRTPSTLDELTCAQSVHSVYSDATTVVAGSASRPKVKVIGGGAMTDGAQAVLPGATRMTRDRSPSLLTDGDFCGASPGDGGRRKKDRQENGAFPSLTRQGGNDRCVMKKKNRKSFLPMLRRSNSTGSMHDVFANPTYHGQYRKGRGDHKHSSLNATITDPSRRHSTYGEGEVIGPPKERIVGFGPEGPPPATPARDAKSEEDRGRNGHYKRTAATRSLDTKIDGVPKISSTGSSSSSSSSNGNSEVCTNSPAPPTKRGIKVKVKKLSNWIACSPARQQPALGPVSTASSSASSSDGVPNHEERDNDRGGKEEKNGAAQEISSPRKNKPAGKDRTAETPYGEKSRGKKQPSRSGNNDNIDPTSSPRAVLDLREC